MEDIGLRICNHKIEWDYSEFEIDDDADCVRFEGVCEVCKRRFMKTFVDAQYSVMDIGSDEWENYSLLGKEEMIN